VLDSLISTAFLLEGLGILESSLPHVNALPKIRAG
jgi:hypothetical protein